MKINSPRQLKDWINNMVAKNNSLNANNLLQNFMMERLLERISVSNYKDNFILKGGFLIAAMVGIDMRSTMDMDTTIKGIPIDRRAIENIINEILSIAIDDNVFFILKDIKNIHDISDHDDFRISVEAHFFTIKVNMKIDITTGDLIIPREIEYSFRLMFEERDLSIKAYNIYTILAEKIESILARNVANTRARDYYDVYILMALRKDEIDFERLIDAIQKKAEERNTLIYVENHDKYLSDIEVSKEMKNIWQSYTNKFPYAENIQFSEIMNTINEIFKRS
ncbi:MAG: nucleotidyl transferase AbiEii/AbiGii toxin family protein [Clostridiales bacterium]|nr:nucleotidyl transferase AbiEii/AbiGii toxin family protein [Clostridiales bacterium]